jgi:ATP-dependent DNA helicase RecQ
MFYSWADVMLHERFLDNLDDDEVRERTRRATIALFELVSVASAATELVAHFDEIVAPCQESATCAPAFGSRRALPS